MENRAFHEPLFRPRRRACPRHRLGGLSSRTKTSTRTSRFMVPMHAEKNERGLSMNLGVLPASCRQRSPRRIVPTGRRHHVGGAVPTESGLLPAEGRSCAHGKSVSRNLATLNDPVGPFNVAAPRSGFTLYHEVRSPVDEFHGPNARENTKGGGFPNRRSAGLRPGAFRHTTGQAPD
jgi:hypothetical protein